MASRLELQPRAPWTIRNLVAAQGLAHVLPTLPIGYWQRRVGGARVRPRRGAGDAARVAARAVGAHAGDAAAVAARQHRDDVGHRAVDVACRRAHRARGGPCRGGPRTGGHAHADVRRGLRGLGQRADTPAAHVAPARHGQRRDRDAPWASSRSTRSSDCSRRPRAISAAASARPRSATPCDACDDGRGIGPVRVRRDSGRLTIGPITNSVLPDGSDRPNVRAPHGSSWGTAVTTTAPWPTTRRSTRRHRSPRSPPAAWRAVAVHRTVERQRDAAAFTPSSPVAILRGIERHREAEPSTSQRPEIGQDPKVRAGFVLVPEMCASSGTMTA